MLGDKAVPPEVPLVELLVTLMLFNFPNVY